jgi:DNA-binding transcriptional LysR family regulator
MMEWDDLKHFLAVARCGSLTAAAAHARTSPATIGRRIGSLEDKLGARLFDRRPSGYTLTESGETIRIRAEEVEEAVLAVEREALGRDRTASGTVRLAATDQTATFVVAPALGEFRERYPGILLEVVTSLELANLSRRDADIALRAARPSEGNLITRRVADLDFGLYAARDYVERRGLVAPLEDFSNVEIITWTEELSHLRGGPWLEERARGRPVALASNSTRLHVAACVAGIGVALMPCLAAEREPGLVCLLPPERVFSVELFMVVHRDLTRTARVRAVMDFLAELGPRLRRPA